jgi:hypothetical protein
VKEIIIPIDSIEDLYRRMCIGAGDVREVLIAILLEGLFLNQEADAPSDAAV